MHVGWCVHECTFTPTLAQEASIEGIRHKIGMLVDLCLDVRLQVLKASGLK
jgi:hypothetical protein